MYSTAPSTATIPDRTEYVQLLAAAVIPAEIFTRMYTVHCTLYSSSTAHKGR